MSSTSANSEFYRWNFLIIDDSVAEAELTGLSVTSSFPEASLDVVPRPYDSLEMLKNKRYQAVILDYHMPELDGLQLLQEFKSLVDLPPVLMLTGRGDENIAVSAIKGGAADYVVKLPDGGHSELLQQRLRQLLISRQAQHNRPSSGRFCAGVVGLTEAGTICFVNHSAAQSLDVTSNELLGYPVLNLLRSIPVGAEESLLRKISSSADWLRVSVVSRSRFFARGEQVADLRMGNQPEMADGLVDLFDNAGWVMPPHALFATLALGNGPEVLVELRLVEKN